MDPGIMDPGIMRTGKRADEEQGQHHMRLALGASGGGGGGGPSMVAEGQSSSAETSRTTALSKTPKFFRWLGSLPDDHPWATAKIFIPPEHGNRNAADAWKSIPIDLLVDRRSVCVHVHPLFATSSVAVFDVGVPCHYSGYTMRSVTF